MKQTNVTADRIQNLIENGAVLNSEYQAVENEFNQRINNLVGILNNGTITVSKKTKTMKALEKFLMARNKHMSAMVRSLTAFATH